MHSIPPDRRPELEKKLYTDFPALYKERPPLSCFPGWFNIIYKLSWDITEIIEANSSLDPEKIVVTEIGSKFCTLKFYVSNGANEEIYERIGQANRESASTCEECGGEGRVKNGGHWSVLCDGCLGMPLKRMQAYLDKHKGCPSGGCSYPDST